MLETGAEQRQLLDQPSQIGTDDEYAVGGLLDHPGKVRDRQPGVERMANDPHTHGAIPALQVRLGVPRHDGEIVALCETEREERT